MYDSYGPTALDYAQAAADDARNASRSNADRLNQIEADIAALRADVHVILQALSNLDRADGQRDNLDL